MKPNEVVKESVEKLEQGRCNSFCSCKGGTFYRLLIDSQLSLLLSVKEMVEKELEEKIKEAEGLSIAAELGLTNALDNISSLLTEEIDKIKK